MEKNKFSDTIRNLRIGSARVTKIARMYEELGYKVILNTGNHEGPDIIIVSSADGRIRKIIEVTNYNNPKQIISWDNFNRYLGTLGYWESIRSIELELIVSYISNLSGDQLQECNRLGIIVNAVGPQDQPEDENKEGWID